MKHLIVVAVALLSLTAFADKQSVQLYPTGVIPLPGVRGRIDHLAYDGAHERLFVAAVGNNSVEIVDLHSNTRTHSLTDLPGPQGVAYLTHVNRILVACAGDGALHIFDGDSYAQVATVALGADADNILCDDDEHAIYVGVGSGGIAVIDPQSMQRVAMIALRGHPEGMRLDDAGARLYVNVPSRREVAVIDTKSNSVETTWSVGARENYDLTISAKDDYCFLGCRRPACVEAHALSSGKKLFTLPIGGDVDGIFYDATLRKLYVSCGAGVVDVYEWVNVDSYKRQPDVHTAHGARTSLLVRSLGVLFVAAPAQGGDDATIRMFRLRPY